MTLTTSGGATIAMYSNAHLHMTVLNCTAVCNKNTFCTLHNINVYYVHCSELGWTEGWHPVEWRDIKTAGEVLPNPLSGQTTHKKLPLVQKVQLKQDS